LAKVTPRDNESIDDLLSRFKRQVIRDGTLNTVRNREFFMNPREKQKLKKKEAQMRKKKKF
jgi:small subunit ribosomal protein S21